MLVSQLQCERAFDHRSSSESVFRHHCRGARVLHRVRDILVRVPGRRGAPTSDEERDSVPSALARRSGAARRIPQGSVWHRH